MLALICPTAPRATAVDADAGLHVDADVDVPQPLQRHAAVDAAVDVPQPQQTHAAADADVEHAVCVSPTISLRSSVAVELGRVSCAEEPLRAPNAGFEGAAPTSIRAGRSQEAGQGRRCRWHCHELRALCERASRGLGWCFCVRGVGIDPREHSFHES